MNATLQEIANAMPYGMVPSRSQWQTFRSLIAKGFITPRNQNQPSLLSTYVITPSGRRYLADHPVKTVVDRRERDAEITRLIHLWRSRNLLYREISERLGEKGYRVSPDGARRIYNNAQSA